MGFVSRHFFTMASFLCTVHYVPGMILDFWLGLFYLDFLCIPGVFFIFVFVSFPCLIAGVHLVIM